MKNNPSICVATPMYGGLCYGTFMQDIMGFKDMAQSRGWNFYFIFTTNESLITRARNKLVELFLQTKFSHLLFIDADMGFAPHDMIKLVEFDEDVVCGYSPKKLINWETVKNLVLSHPNIPSQVLSSLASEYCINTLDKQANTEKPELKEVKHAGTGCMLIKREVFLKLQHTLPTYIDYGYDGNSSPVTKSLFFDTKVDENSSLYLSEDYYFCNEWRKIGGSVYVAPNIKLKHIGNYTYG